MRDLCDQLPPVGFPDPNKIRSSLMSMIEVGQTSSEGNKQCLGVGSSAKALARLRQSKEGSTSYISKQTFCWRNT
eukprot:2907172-Amphidinium_carterae.1